MKRWMRFRVRHLFFLMAMSCVALVALPPLIGLCSWCVAKAELAQLVDDFCEDRGESDRGLQYGKGSPIGQVLVTNRPLEVHGRILGSSEEIAPGEMLIFPPGIVVKDKTEALAVWWDYHMSRQQLVAYFDHSR